jgi:hypothetical protein
MPKLTSSSDEDRKQRLCTTGLDTMARLEAALVKLYGNALGVPDAIANAFVELRTLLLQRRGKNHG